MAQWHRVLPVLHLTHLQPRTCWKKLPLGSWNLNSFDLLLLCGRWMDGAENLEPHSETACVNLSLFPPAAPASQLLYLSICCHSHSVSYPSAFLSVLQHTKVAHFVKPSKMGGLEIRHISNLHWSWKHIRKTWAAQVDQLQKLAQPQPVVKFLECQPRWNPAWCLRNTLAQKYKYILTPFFFFLSFCVLSSPLSCSLLFSLVALLLALPSPSRISPPSLPRSSFKATAGFHVFNEFSRVIKKFNTRETEPSYGSTGLQRKAHWRKNHVSCSREMYDISQQECTRRLFLSAARSYVCFGAVSGQSLSMCKHSFCVSLAYVLWERGLEREWRFCSWYMYESFLLCRSVFLTLHSQRLWRRQHIDLFEIYKEGLS